MKLSMNWLKDYYEVSTPLKTYIDDMTMAGNKVEGYKQENEGIHNVVVGKILSVVPHPNADSLVICQIDVGKNNPLQIVTGAPNVKTGDLVPVAKHNSTLPNGNKITKGKLRGELSEGMLCSLSELNLTVSDFPYAVEDGIFILEEPCSVGDPIDKAIGLDDTVVEFEITSNRPDCLSVIGLARESAAMYGSKLVVKAPKVKAGGSDINNIIKASVENKEGCKRYMVAAVENVKIATSPRWLRERLRASGVRPINNIVDITNYVMLEYGQPMHAFDLRHVGGQSIIVRDAKQGETIVTLDGVEHKLSSEMLVIADNNGPTAVAGVMGGEYSGVYEDTTTVIFESACFDGASVRKTAKKLGLRTESSGRFEKGLDSRGCEDALLRALELIELLEIGTVASGIVDIDNDQQVPKTLELEADWTNKFIGVEIPKEEMIEILENLWFSVEGNTIIVPSFRRGDVDERSDIAEEIIRIYSYNKIPTTVLRGESKGVITREQKFRCVVNNTLIGAGYSEIITYSFFSPSSYDKILLPADSSLRDSVTIRNPLGEDTSVLRTTPMPSLLTALSHNYNNRNPKAKLFEIATTYHKTEEGQLPDEPKTIMIGQYGEDTDFFSIKGGVEALLERIGIKSGIDWVSVSDNPTYHPGRTAQLLINGEPAGILGEAHPKVLENYGISSKTCVAELSYQVLFGHYSLETQFKALPKFPASTRDLALVAGVEVPAGNIEKIIAETMGSLLEKLELFDVYEGSQLGEDKKSVAYSVTLRAEDRTLTDKESDDLVSKLLAALKEIDIFLRG